MKKYFFILIFIIFSNESLASIKNEIIQNLNNIDHLSFNFEQNINGKLEKGKCTIQYPKKIFCKYDLSNGKILVSNGKSLVIKTITSYYLYPLEKTPLNFILDKKFLLSKIQNLKQNSLDENYISFKFYENDNQLNIFFNKKNYNLIGWQTVDIYQNLSMTYLSSITKNQKIDKNLFLLPKN